MKIEHQQFFCEEVRQLWRGLECRPWGVWIREHASVQPPDYHLTSHVAAAWFLDSRAITVKSPFEFVRFYTVHGTRPWHTGTLPPPPSGIFRSGIHDIGLAGFAPIAATGQFYFEWQFGGLFGRGATYAINAAGQLHLAENVYVS